jgi:hypothetical protein
MPSIDSVQQAALNELESFASVSISDIGPVELTVTERILTEYGAEFKLLLERLIKDRKITASGNLADISNPEVVTEAGVTKLIIRMPYYYDFVNKGVRGIKSSRNAPKSPYQFRTYGISDGMRRSLTLYVKSNRAKISTVKKIKDRALGIGLERKGLKSSTRPTIEQQVNTLGYMIKAYGIKERGYFDDAFDKVFANFEVVMQEAVGTDIILTLTRK